MQDPAADGGIAAAYDSPTKRRRSGPHRTCLSALGWVKYGLAPSLYTPNRIVAVFSEMQGCAWPQVVLGCVHNEDYDESQQHTTMTPSPGAENETATPNRSAARGSQRLHAVEPSEAKTSPRAAERPPHNLPLKLSSFIGLVGAGTTFTQQQQQQQVIGGAIQCDGIPCVATGDSQVLFEQVSDGVRDRMLDKGKHDILRAQTYTNDCDVVRGGYGKDGDDFDGVMGSFVY